MDDLSKRVIGSNRVIGTGKILIMGDGHSAEIKKLLKEMQDKRQEFMSAILVPEHMIALPPAPLSNTEIMIHNKLNVSTEEYIEVLLELGKVGVSARQAGKSMRQAIIRLSKCSMPRVPSLYREDELTSDLPYAKQQAQRWANSYSRKNKKKSKTIRPAQSRQRIMFSRNSLSSEHYAVTKERPANNIH